MWKCIRCGAEFLDTSEVEPDIDDFGAHFVCPKCGRRNDLKGSRDADGELLLEQEDETE